MLEWDEEKRAQNLKKHGVDFIDAASIFENPVIETADHRNGYGETRHMALGHIDDQFYTVIYTWRGKARRLISAWKAGTNAKKRYQAVFTRRT